MRAFYLLVLFAGLVANVFLFQNCASPFDAISVNQLASTEPPPPEPGQKITFSALAPVQAKLAETQSLSGQVSSLDGFSGSVEISVDRTQLNLQDSESNVRIEVVPSQVNVPAGGSANFSINVATDDMAPSFDFSSVQLIATDPTGDSLPANIQLNLKVDPIVELRMNGNADPLLRWDRPSAALNFRNHSTGMMVRFINVNAASTHVVHGNGAIPHGPVGDPMQSPATDGSDGGVYEVIIANGTVDDGSYYYHDLGEDGDEREMFFGVTSNLSALSNMQKSVSPAVMAMINGTQMPADTPGCAGKE